FAQEVRDNVVYQALPMAADSTYEIGMLANADAYVSNTLPGTGHLRVNVDPACVKVDFIRAWLPKDTSATRRNGEIAFSYSLGSCAVTSTDNTLPDEESDIRVFPNPASGWIQAGWPRAARVTGMSLFDMQGRLLSEAQGVRMDLSRIPNGEYVLRLSQDGRSVNRKILIRK
ncbi:MAG: T9SS C-terminal target domain-containing protein, partial [Chitinophagia bacterium]|nr:T9SS C-terminal target domain-containing protein [Chitinophagia bacterium]